MLKGKVTFVVHLGNIKIHGYAYLKNGIPMEYRGLCTSLFHLKKVTGRIQNNKFRFKTKNKESLIPLIGILILLSIFFVVLYTFFFAYFHDGYVIININQKGESHLELIALLVLIPISVYSVYYFFKKEIKNKIGGIL